MATEVRELTPRQEIRQMERAMRSCSKLGRIGQEFIASWLLNTTQEKLRLAGFEVRAHKSGHTNG